MERKRGLYAAWHTEAFRRVKRLPTLKSLLGLGREGKLSPEELTKQHEELIEAMGGNRGRQK